MGQRPELTTDSQLASEVRQRRLAFRRYSGCNRGQFAMHLAKMNRDCTKYIDKQALAREQQDDRPLATCRRHLVLSEKFQEVSLSKMYVRFRRESTSKCILLFFESTDLIIEGF
jgi:hypothetical protein